jgi:hypothetical protein
MNSKHISYVAALVAAGTLFAGVAPADAAPATQHTKSATSSIRSEPDLTGVWARYPSPFPPDLGDDEDVPPPKPGPDLKEPYASQWKAKRDRRAAMLKAGTPLVDPSTNCLPEGMPGIMQAIYPIEILQTPGRITVLAELFMQTRRIYVDQPFPAPDDMAPTYNGFSSAHWEGDTLLVETRGIKTDVEFFEIPHSDAMTVKERYRLTAPDMLTLDVSIEDPQYLKTPYRFTWVYKRDHEYRIPEYVCDNRKDVINPDGTVSYGVE